MLAVAVVSQDFLIVAGMLTAGALGALGAWRAKLVFVKAGALLSALMVCLGLAYFGLLPLLGGSHPPGTYFGSTMLFLGLMGGAIVGAVEEGYRRVTSGGTDERHGFPVISSPGGHPASP